MENDNDKIKLIGAVAAGAIGGLLLGSYIWGNRRPNSTLSNHLSTLSNILKEIEEMKTDETEDLKERINDILSAIKSAYVKAEFEDNSADVSEHSWEALGVHLTMYDAICSNSYVISSDEVWHLFHPTGYAGPFAGMEFLSRPFESTC